MSDLGSEEQAGALQTTPDRVCEALLSSRATILRQSVLEGIQVPLLRGDLEALQAIASDTQQASGPTQQAPSDELLVDFSLLPEEKQAASHGAAAQLLEAEYRTELERQRMELERLNPNLKATEQLQGVAENLQAPGGFGIKMKKGRWAIISFAYLNSQLIEDV